ncbi:uridine kinase [Sphingorhabdus sp. M41]|uniref:uridine kinase n=1 Tax=Sphingorhabdus sp. M41 TaxID=1806885 RepID=UPI00078B5EE7|nr:uridine kinase [Sphingorhabdus sp. M41]AMO73115.1 hypothetical protein AZE99_15765 [Sphingorhabdus sp. M41]
MTAKVVGISGGSCSGKSTLTQLLFDALGPQQCVILPQDDYFFGLGDAPLGKGGPNFDHPHAVDFDKLSEQLAQLKSGQAIDRPLYDFPTHMPKTETLRTEPRPVILVDGILILQHQPLRDLLDLSIFVECDSDTRFARRLERDVRERGRTAQSVHEQFANQVGPMHDLHVEPSKSHADIVVNSQQSQSHYETPLRMILSKISLQNQ